MAECIEREAAINGIYELIKARQEWKSDARGEIQGLNAAMCAIEDILPADVQPVRHGRWEKNDDGIMIWWECSECHLNAWYDGYNLYDYCPNCGATMDLEALSNGN